MRRLLVAAFIALALHVLLFSVRVERRKERSLSSPTPLCLSLSYKSPEIQGAPSLPLIRQTPTLPDPPPERVVEPKEKQPAQKTKAPAKPRKSPKPPTKRTVRETKPAPVKTEDPSIKEQSPEHTAPGDKTPYTHTPNQDSAMESPGNTLASLPPPENPAGDPGAIPLREAVPVYRKNPRPEYPPVARRRGYEGTVIMEVFVDREGKVQDFRLYQTSGHEILDRAAMQAVKGWLFEPATRGGVRIEMWVKIPLSFRLE